MNWAAFIGTGVGLLVAVAIVRLYFHLPVLLPLFITAGVFAVGGGLLHLVLHPRKN